MSAKDVALNLVGPRWQIEQSAVNLLYLYPGGRYNFVGHTPSILAMVSSTKATSSLLPISSGVRWWSS